jgi:acyl-coenzyme A thioesterase PaaI-like protein
MIKTLDFAGEFEPAFIDGVKEIFEDKIVFNRVLGLRITELRPTTVKARIEMRNDLIGHYAHNRIHGARHMDESPQKRLERFSKLGTIDLRVDYLRPGIGAWFELTAEVLRLGSRVGSTRMEFRGADGKLLSTGAGAYIVS